MKNMLDQTETFVKELLDQCLNLVQPKNCTPSFIKYKGYCYKELGNVYSLRGNHQEAI